LPLSKAINKYGKDNFLVEELEECPIELLDEREAYWIKYYDTYGEKGYNCNGGGSFDTFKEMDEDVEKIYTRYQQGERLDLLCKEFHHNYVSIVYRFNKKGYKINTQAGPQKLSKPVLQFDLKDNFIAEYPSVSAAARAMGQTSSTPINNVVRHCKYRHTSAGFKWIYKSEYEELNKTMET
jgi:group I intron endonuclease